MGTARINGVHLHYELFGEGRPVVLTSGGRSGWKQLELLASALASRFRVLVWDRRNAGASDVSIGGDGSESDLG